MLSKLSKLSFLCIHHSLFLSFYPPPSSPPPFVLNLCEEEPDEPQLWQLHAVVTLLHLKGTVHCPANSNRGQYYAQIIRAGKLEVPPIFFSNFKGTPSQKEHKTIFSGLKISKWLCLDKVTLRALFPAICYTLCDTYIDFPQTVNSEKSIF